MRDSGINVVLSEKVSDSKTAYSPKQAVLVSLICFVYLLMGECGVIFALTEGFHIEVPLLWTIGIIAGVSIVTAFLLSLRKWKLQGLFFLLVVCVGFVICFWKKLTVGFSYIWECIGIKFDAYFYAAEESSILTVGSEQQILLAVFVICLVTALLIGASVFLWKSMSASFVLFLIVDGLTLLVGLVPPVWVVLVQLLSLIGIALLGGCRNRQPVFGTVTRIDTRIGLRQKMQVQITLMILLLVLIVLGLSAVLLTPVYAKVEEERENVNQIRQEIQDFAINGWDDFDFSITSHGTMGINGGALGDYRSISAKEQVDLYVTSDVTYPGTVFIKGYVGGLYTGDRWDQILFQEWAETYYGKGGTWELDVEEVYVSQEYTNLYYMKSMLGETDQIVLSTAMKVDMEHAQEKYSYLPGFPQAAMLGSQMPLYGWAERISTSASYVTALTSPGWLLEQLGNIDSGEYRFPETQSEITITDGNQMAEVEYDLFVRENYLQVPDQVLGRVEKDWDDYLLAHPLENHTYTELADRVKAYLQERAEYTMTPGKTPAGEDFIDYFIFTQKRGYCVHFASAAVMLFRMSGIPARYVEGYTIDGVQAGVQTVVQDTQAHAWCEIYVEDFGWIPVDVTPGNGEVQTVSGGEDGSGAAENESTLWDSEEDSSGAAENESTLSDSEEDLEGTEAETEGSGESGQQIAVPDQVTPGEGDLEIPGGSARIGTAVLKKVCTVLAVIAAVGLAIFGIRKRSSLLLGRRKTRMQQANCRLAILAAYRYTMALTNGTAYSVGMDLSGEDFLKIYPEGDEVLFQRWKDLVQEAYFSCHEMSNEDREDALQFYRYLYQETLLRRKNQKPAGRLLIKCRKLWRTYGSCYPKL